MYKYNLQRFTINWLLILSHEQLQLNMQFCFISPPVFYWLFLPLNRSRYEMQLLESSVVVGWTLTCPDALRTLNSSFIVCTLISWYFSFRGWIFCLWHSWCDWLQEIQGWITWSISYQWGRQLAQGLSFSCLPWAVVNNNIKFSSHVIVWPQPNKYFSWLWMHPHVLELRYIDSMPFWCVSGVLDLPCFYALHWSSTPRLMTGFVG